MTQFSRDATFEGVEDFFPDELKPGIAELSRRLERFLNSVTLQIRNQPGAYISDMDIQGVKEYDFRIDADGIRYFDGASWIWVVDNR